MNEHRRMNIRKLALLILLLGVGCGLLFNFRFLLAILTIDPSKINMLVGGDTTYLHRAVLGDDLRLMEYLLQKGADANYSLQPPGFIASSPPLAYAKSEKAARLLLRYGARVDGIGDNGPLLSAVLNRRYGVVKVLIENGAAVNRSSGGMIPLLLSVYPPERSNSNEVDITIVQLLLDHGASVNAVDEDGNTALHYAVHANRLDLVTLLLQFKADKSIKNTSGNTPYMVAKKLGYSDIAFALQ